MHPTLTAQLILWNDPLTLTGIELDDILKRARRMDLEALAKIHDQHYPEVYRYVRYRLEDEQLCEDITSEVFLRLLNALNDRRGPNKSLRGWLLGTASNLVNDHLRQRYSRQVENVEAGEASEALQNGQSASPEHTLDERWQHQEVRHAIQKLTNEQQHVLALRFAEQLSLEETASIIGKSVTAVKGLQFRALNSLRRLLEERD